MKHLRAAYIKNLLVFLTFSLMDHPVCSWYFCFFFKKFKIPIYSSIFILYCFFKKIFS